MLPLTVDSILAALEVNAETRRAAGAKRLALFGSHARGEAGPDSDLDFLVELREHSWLSYLSVLRLLEQTFGRQIDLIEITALKPRVAANVAKEARLV